jgi:hypothetical protein
MIDYRKYEDDITSQLQKILNHPLFCGAKRSCSFLNYVTNQVITGNRSQIKEYSIAVDAFGLETTFDQQIDPRIRVEAKRLRDRLTQYYNGPGQNDLIFISLPKGSYIPEFHLNHPDSFDQKKEIREENNPISILVDKRFNIQLRFFNMGVSQVYIKSIQVLQSLFIHMLFQQCSSPLSESSLSEIVALQEKCIPQVLDVCFLSEGHQLIVNLRLKMKPAGMLIRDSRTPLQIENIEDGETYHLILENEIKNLLDFLRRLKL